MNRRLRSPGGYNSRNRDSYRPSSRDGYRPRSPDPQSRDTNRPLSRHGYPPRSSNDNLSRSRDEYHPHSLGGYRPRFGDIDRPRFGDIDRPRFGDIDRPRFRHGQHPNTDSYHPSYQNEPSRLDRSIGHSVNRPVNTTQGSSQLRTTLQVANTYTSRLPVNKTSSGRISKVSPDPFTNNPIDKITAQPLTQELLASTRIRKRTSTITQVTENAADPISTEASRNAADTISTQVTQKSAEITSTRVTIEPPTKRRRSARSSGVAAASGGIDAFGAHKEFSLRKKKVVSYMESDEGDEEDADEVQLLAAPAKKPALLKRVGVPQYTAADKTAGRRILSHDTDTAMPAQIPHVAIDMAKSTAKVAHTVEAYLASTGQEIPHSEGISLEGALAADLAEARKPQQARAEFTRSHRSCKLQIRNLLVSNADLLRRLRVAEEEREELRKENGELNAKLGEGEGEKGV